MKRILLYTIFLGIFISTLKSQTFFQENFEDYNAGQTIVDQSDDWITWSGNAAEDISITDTNSQSGDNALLCQGDMGDDIVLPLDNLNEGSYVVEFSMFVVSGNGAYYNFQEDEVPGTAWAFENFFATDGSWEVIMDTEVIGGGTFPHDQWFLISNKIDLINDEITIEIDGVAELTFPFDSPLGGVNIFPFAPNFETALYYIDDVYVYKSFEGFEDYPDGISLGLVSQQWGTWSGSGEGTDEDAVVTNFLAATGSNCAQFSGNMTHVIYPMGDFSQGLWELNMKIFTGSGGGGFLSVQHFEEPGLSYANQIYFGEGSGNLDAGGVEIASFSWDDDQWNELTHVIDLDSDVASILINGETIHTWTFSDEALSSGTGESVLGGVEFYPQNSPDGTVGNFFVDDITFSRTDIILSDDALINSISGLNIFPNPTNNLFYIENTGNIQLKGSIQVLDALGKLLDQRNVNLNSLEMVVFDASLWKPGIYFVRIENTSQSKIMKLIVQ